MRKIQILALLLAALAGSVSAQTPNGAYSSPATGSGGFPVTTSVTVNSGGSITPSGTGAIGATNLLLKNVIDVTAAPYNVVPGFYTSTATITNGSPTITTGTNDPACVQATQAGWAIFGVKYPGTSGFGLISNPLAMAEGTISSCTAHSITSSTNGNAGASGIANNILVWGPIVDTQLAAAEAAAFTTTGNCTTLLLANGPMLVHGAHFLTISCTSLLDSSLNDTGATILGWSYRTSLIVPTPNFSFTGCTWTSAAACFGMVGGTYYHDWGVWGGDNGGVGLTNTNAVISMNNTDQQISNFYLGGWMSDDQNFIGLNVGSSAGQYPITVIEDAAGGVGCQVAGAVFVNFVGTFCGDNKFRTLRLLTGGANQHVRSFGSVFGFTAGATNIELQSGTIWDSYGDSSVPHAASADIQVEAGAVLNLDGWISETSFGTPNQTLWVNGGTVHAINSQFGGSVNCMTVDTSGIFDDEGGNTCVPGNISLAAGANTMKGRGALSGACTGVVTSATTVGLYSLGQFTTSTCVTAAVGLGRVMNYSGSIYGLSCTATAGNQATDACTVVKNGAAQTMTCSLNGVASCVDVTAGHVVAFVPGDIISIEVIGGALTTLANVKGTAVTF